MITRNDIGYYTLQCDNCGDEPDEDFDTFQEAVTYKKETAKAEGWRSVKDGNDEWWDLCPSCATPENMRKIREGTS